MRWAPLGHPSPLSAGFHSIFKKEVEPHRVAYGQQKVVCLTLRAKPLKKKKKGKKRKEAKPSQRHPSTSPHPEGA